MDCRLPDGYRARPDAAAPLRWPTVRSQQAVFEFGCYLAARSEAARLIVIGCRSLRALAALDAPTIMVVDAEAMRSTVREALPAAEFCAWELRGELPARVKAAAADAVVICADLVQRLAEPGRFLTGLAELSRVAAYVLVGTCDRARLRGWMDFGPPADPTHLREWTADEFGRLMRDCGVEPPLVNGHAPHDDAGSPKNTILAVAGRDAQFRMPSRSVSVAAILHTYNEADIVRSTVQHLHDEGVEVHVFDNWSTDATYGVLSDLEREGLVAALARFPDAAADEFALGNQLRHTAAYARSLDAAWVMHHDADELRVSPWPAVRLRDAISFVDARGYSAIDFTVLNFRFVDRTSPAAAVPRFFEFGRQPTDLVQIKAWKNVRQRVELASSGGHEAAFDGRRIHPFKFLTRHYPLRSFEHANRKVFRERLPRVRREKAEHGWHVHYDVYDRIGRLEPWRRHELHDFEPHAFNDQFLIERLSGIGIEVEERAGVPNIETVRAWMTDRNVT